MLMPPDSADPVVLPMFSSLTLALAGALLPVVQDASSGDSSADAFLAQVQASLYRPQEDGLRSVSFVAPVIEDGKQMAAMLAGSGMTVPDLPRSLRMAEVSVTWTSGENPVIKGTVADDLPPQLANVAQQLRAAMPQRGDQLLTAMLNREVDFDNLLAVYDAQLEPGPNRRTTVVLSRKAQVSEALAPPPRITWTFETDGAPHQSIAELPAQPAARMPPSTITSTHVWRRVGSAGRLLLESLSVVIDLETAGQVDLHTTFHYTQVDSITLLSGLTEAAEQHFGPNSPPPMTKTTLLEDLLVNGAPSGNG